MRSAAILAEPTTTTGWPAKFRLYMGPVFVKIQQKANITVVENLTEFLVPFFTTKWSARLVPGWDTQCTCVLEPLFIPELVDVTEQWKTFWSSELGEPSKRVSYTWIQEPRQKNDRQSYANVAVAKISQHILYLVTEQVWEAC